MDIKNTTEELLTAKEAADLLKVTEVTIKRYIAKKLIPSVKIGGARRIVKGDMLGQLCSKNTFRET
jgi:excisionase family DNA binding protein